MSELTSEDLRAIQAARVAAFRPLGDQILVELEPEHAAYVGLLIIPDSAEADINAAMYSAV